MIKLNKYNNKLVAIYEELDDLIGKLEEKRDAIEARAIEKDRDMTDAERIPRDADILYFLNNSSRAGKVLHAYPCGTWAEAQRLAEEWNAKR